MCIYIYKFLNGQDKHQLPPGFQDSQPGVQGRQRALQLQLLSMKFLLHMLPAAQMVFVPRGLPLR